MRSKCSARKWSLRTSRSILASRFSATEDVLMTHRTRSERRTNTFSSQQFTPKVPPNRHPQTESGSLPDVPGRTHREDAFVAAGEKHPFQKPTTLIVEEVFVPFVFHELGYNQNNATIGMLFRKVENELNDGNDDEAVG
jgi:hypothetical protein